MSILRHFTSFLGRGGRGISCASGAHRLITCPVGNKNTTEGEDGQDEEGEEEEPVNFLVNLKIS